MKSISEACHTDLSTLHDVVSEMQESHNVFQKDTKTELGVISRDVSLIKSQNFENAALLKENLKKSVSDHLKTPPASNSSRSHNLPMTPPTAPPPFKCFTCGDTGHPRSRCPMKAGDRKKAEFCPRCLDPGHQMFDCPSISERCQICAGNSLGALAYGHMRHVHYVTDKAKRDAIARAMPKICFADWFSIKRKASDA
eukprot:GFUD01108896.1.p1 GENE.GFUD01108896.1~~GFUD01108896.1.p1  ORF type:complete len:197 (+),score=27.62 GFUD01108896.1:1-591(+)